MCCSKNAKYLKLSGTKKKQLPVLFSESPHHAGRRGSVIWDWAVLFVLLPSLSFYKQELSVARISSEITILSLALRPCPRMPPLTCTFCSFFDVNHRLTHTNYQLNHTVRALWTGLHWFPHILSSECEWFWVVACQPWHLCDNCVWLASQVPHSEKCLFRILQKRVN